MNSNEMSLEVLRAEAEEIRRDSVWPGYRWPEDFKRRVRELHRDGFSAVKIAEGSVLPLATVRMWLGSSGSAKPEKKFVEVPAKKVEMKDVSISLERGKKIEGLRIEDIRDLLMSGAL